MFFQRKCKSLFVIAFFLVNKTDVSNYGRVKKIILFLKNIQANSWGYMKDLLDFYFSHMESYGFNYVPDSGMEFYDFYDCRNSGEK